MFAIQVRVAEAGGASRHWCNRRLGLGARKGQKSVVKGREACDGGVLVSSSQVARRPHRSSSPFLSASRASHARSRHINACRPPDWFAQRPNTCRRSPNPRATPRPRGRPAHAPHDAHARCCCTQATQIPSRHRHVCDTAPATRLARLLARVAAVPPFQHVAAQAVRVDGLNIHVAAQLGQRNADRFGTQRHALSAVFSLC